MDSSPKARRRSLRFSLKTLFLLPAAVACLLLGYQLNWIRQRHAVLNSPSIRFTDSTVEWTSGDENYDVPEDGLIVAEPPLLLRSLGEKGYGQLFLVSPETDFELVDESDPELARIRSLFPEAHVFLIIENP